MPRKYSGHFPYFPIANPNYYSLQLELSGSDLGNAKMGEKFIHTETLQDGTERKLHVDFEDNTVHIENGVHPVTGDPLLRFSSNNVAPFLFLKAKPAEAVLNAPVFEGAGFLGDIEPLEIGEANVIVDPEREEERKAIVDEESLEPAHFEFPSDEREESLEEEGERE